MLKEIALYILQSLLKYVTMAIIIRSEEKNKKLDKFVKKFKVKVSERLPIIWDIIYKSITKWIIKL